MAKAKSQEGLVQRASAALAPWEQEEARHAQDVKSKETMGVARITTRGAEFKIDGKSLGRELVVVPIAAAKEKAFYTKKFDPSTPATPDCYAFTDDKNEEKVMVAHDAALHKQNLQPDGRSPCNGCKWNAFNTAEVGRGKRCKDYRRWLVITPVRDQAGNYSLDPESVRKAEKRQLQVPPSSLKAYGNYLAALQDKTRTGSIREMMVKLELYSLDQGGHGLKFEPLKGLDQKTHEAVVAVGNLAAPMLVQPYPALDSEEKEPPKQMPAKSRRKLD